MDPDKACHPSIASFQGKIYMACTPYPYNGEGYENPCLYVLEPENHRYQPVPGAFPLILPRHLGFEHYSDPCLFVRDERLVLLFRKCERREEGGIDLLYTSSSKNGADWSEPRLLAEDRKDLLISPAAGNRELFCVEYNGIDSHVVRYEFDNLTGLGEKHICRIANLVQDFFVWHMDCAIQPDGTVRGLFVLIRKSSSIPEHRLALSSWLPAEHVWRRERDLPLTKAEQSVIRFIYKSSFTEDPSRLLCSARDWKYRWFLFEKTI